jgi:hypothetical protein
MSLRLFYGCHLGLQLAERPKRHVIIDAGAFIEGPLVVFELEVRERPN